MKTRQIISQHSLRPVIGLTLVLWLAIGCGFPATPSLGEVATATLIPVSPASATPAPPIFTQQPILAESTPTPPLPPVSSPPGHPTALPRPPTPDARAQAAGAQVEINAHPAAATVGDLITLTGRPTNLGLPQYTLYLRGEPAVVIRYDGELIFQGFTGAVVEFVSASASQSEVEFTLRAAQPGVVEAMISESGEVRLDATPGPTTGFAWSAVTSPGVTLTVGGPASLPTPPPLSCDTHTAGVELSASPPILRVGELVTVTVTLRNQGCSQLGLPRYSLVLTPTRFDPGNPPEVIHSLAILPGGSDTAEFVLRAVEAGLTGFDAYTTFEVLLNTPPPTAGGANTTAPLTINILPAAQAAPLPAMATISQWQGSVDAVFNQGELLYLNIGPTLAILKLTNPLWPELVGAVALPVNSVSDITVANGYAYVAADEAGLRIVDLSNLANPVEVGSYQPPLAGRAQWEGPAPYGPDTPRYLYAQGARSVAVGAASNGRIYAYVAAQGAGLQIVDISNPAAPTEVGFYETPGDAVDIVVANRLAYVAAFEGGLRIIDVSQPATPTEVGALVRPDEGWFLGVTAADHAVYLAEGHCANDFGCSGFLKGVDVSNPAAPTVVWHTTQGPATHIVLAGRYAYAVGWGLWPIDLTDPTRPVFYYTDISYTDYSSTYQANFIKQAAAATGYLYLAAGEAGLRILDVSDPAIPVEVNTLFAPQR